MKRIVVGLGSGRSGTVSLSHLLDSQPGVAVTHECRPVLPWVVSSTGLIEARVDALLQRPEQTVGDVAYYYLPYVETLGSLHTDIRFLCMRRDFEQTVRSMMVKTEGRNHWVEHDGSEWSVDATWDPTMPSFDPMAKEEAVRRYIRTYYEEAERHQQRDPQRFRIFDLHVLNDPEQAVELLAFAGIENGVVDASIHENRLLS